MDKQEATLVLPLDYTKAFNNFKLDNQRNGTICTRKEQRQVQGLGSRTKAIVRTFLEHPRN